VTLSWAEQYDHVACPSFLPTTFQIACQCRRFAADRFWRTKAIEKSKKWHATCVD